MVLSWGVWSAWEGRLGVACGLVPGSAEGWCWPCGGCFLTEAAPGVAFTSEIVLVHLPLAGTLEVCCKF